MPGEMCTQSGHYIPHHPLNIIPFMGCLSRFKKALSSALRSSPDAPEPHDDSPSPHSKSRTATELSISAHGNIESAASLPPTLSPLSGNPSSTCSPPKHPAPQDLEPQAEAPHPSHDDPAERLDGHPEGVKPSQVRELVEILL